MSNAATLKVAPKDDREIVVTREFDAPRALVYDAHTKPELLKRWLLGPDGWSLVVCDMDLRVGGAYRWVWRNASGKEMGLGGVFREIAPPERIVATERFDESWYPGEAVETVVLTEQAGKTTLTSTVRYQSREARDGVLRSPMEQGVSAGYDKLDEVLASPSARERK